MTATPAILRAAEPGDVPAICAFGADQVGPHYAPLLGADAAAAQVRWWWNEDEIGKAVTSSVVVVAEHDGRLVGVGQLGRHGDDDVVYKLYLHRDHRGAGLGPRLLDALVDRLPPDAPRLFIEHFAANERAGALYERLGFAVHHVESASDGDPRSAVVWRVRELTSRARPPR